MAKNDRQKLQTVVDTQGNKAQQGLNTVNSNLSDQNRSALDRFNISSNQSDQDYSKLMSGYQNVLNQAQNSFGDVYSKYSNLANGGGNISLDPKYQGQLDNAIAGYQDFANTGGFSDQAIQDLRSRAIAPTRAVYANAQQNIDRQRKLQGGYSPNYTAATAKLTRDSADSISGANEQANASIAQMQQQGRLSGLQGLSSTSLAQQSAKTAIDQINSQLSLAGMAGMSDAEKSRLLAELGAMSGMTGLYSATPGRTSMYGSQLANSNSQLLQGQGLQQNLAQYFTNGQMGVNQTPSNFQQGLGNFGSVLGLGGQVASTATGLGGSGKGGGSSTFPSGMGYR